MNSETQIIPGSVVQLKSGGPMMTVDEAHQGINKIECVWFDSENVYHKSGEFNGVYSLESYLFNVISSPDPNEPALKNGDTVTLRSGGPAMTVREITLSSSSVQCLYFASDKVLKPEYFLIKGLRVVESFAAAQ